MLPQQLFRYCPRCGAPRHDTAAAVEENAPAEGNTLSCPACGFLYFFNPCCAVGGFLFNPAGEILLLQRAKEPARGLLAVPGGFIDIGETAELALRRETREEVGLEIESPRFLCSQVNSYHYREVTYPVLDLFFVATALRPETAGALDAVDAFHWQKPAEVNLEWIAFPSVREALRQLVSTS